MPSVETLIVAIGLASMAAVVGGYALMLREFTRDPHRVSLRARYRRGRHHHPSLWTRLADAYLAGAREMATASALLKGIPL